MAKVLIVTAECDPQICTYFSQRGNGINVRLPAIVEREDLMRFLEEPCEVCGQQVRVVTEPQPAVP